MHQPDVEADFQQQRAGEQREGQRQHQRAVLRRLLRSIAKGENITQDVSTLENPAILEQLKQTT